MNNLFNNFIQAAKEVKMTSAEKRRILFSILENSFSVQHQSIRSPFSLYTFFHKNRRKAFALAAVLILILTGGGTSYAAESSLPGEPLYSIKVNVNESIDSFVALTPDAKVKVEVGHTKRRLEEVESLSKKGALNTETQGIIEVNLKKHTDTIKENLSVLASENATNTVKEAITDITASFEAHEVALSSISSSTVSSSTSEHIDSFLSVVNEVKNEISEIGKNSTSTDATSTPVSATSTPSNNVGASSTPVSIIEPSTASTTISTSATTSKLEVITDLLKTSVQSKHK